MKVDHTPRELTGNDNFKHCRTLMSRATGARPDLLADRELAALVGIDWDVNAVLRANGLAS